ncbi:P-loop containing nucleoside triphosphate hydrolase protein [Polychytrium aggregatum]|uniref:P-loop containing nucleoside triphosphate hydrolase protein n=1 Tax=Polychytrium aggregatum TaxID=110093 RepID=UPI0022FE3A73|nr:P-loop containing nucleoside triphosphate hydrolase protein [Polychytrium aggregatum]KAI9207089.1 P-loop containing nucleoside triphosphate hydrolase protein [Polychytrium aggregatum]
MVKRGKSKTFAVQEKQPKAGKSRRSDEQDADLPELFMTSQQPDRLGKAGRSGVAGKSRERTFVSDGEHTADKTGRPSSHDEGYSEEDDEEERSPAEHVGSSDNSDSERRLEDIPTSDGASVEPEGNQDDDDDGNAAADEDQDNSGGYDNAPAKTSHTFSELGLNPWLVDALKSLSIRTASEIQASCIPMILAGRNVIGSAKTGSGKTAAFALPILQKLAEDPYGVFALVLTPTRELAFQIAEQFRVLGAGINLKQSVVVGGMDMMAQAIELSKRPHVVIATPGRLVDHIHSSSNSIHFKRLKFLVLDEADRMLEDTFADDLQVILQQVPQKRQTLLFTATITKDIEGLQLDPNTQPFVYKCAEKYDTVEKLDQRYLFIPSTVRDAYLAHILRNDFDGKTAIIFTSKCRTCERIRVMLRELGLKSTALHAEMSQADRIGSLAKFKSNIVPILIATDVGSRGLDIPTVQVVINYELPADATDYIHRVGRTARAGRGGLAVSMVTERDINVLLNIEGKTKKKLTEYKVEEQDVLEALNEVSLARRVANMHLADTNFGARRRINKEKQQKLEQGSRGEPRSKDDRRPAKKVRTK